MRTRSIAVAAVLLGVACTLEHDTPHAAITPAAKRAAVEAAMQHYIRLTKLVNSDSVAALFAEDGEMLQPGAAAIRGRPAVRAFLAPFDGKAIVDTVTSVTDLLEVMDTTAYLWGRYHQVAHIPPAAPAALDGRLVARWRLESDGVWRLARLLMQPAPAQ